MDKPNIDDVYLLFHVFHMKATYINRDHFREPKVWTEKMQEARKELKDGLEKIGLAEHIDWEAKKD